MVLASSRPNEPGAITSRPVFFWCRTTGGRTNSPSSEAGRKVAGAGPNHVGLLFGICLRVIGRSLGLSDFNHRECAFVPCQDYDVGYVSTFSTLVESSASSNINITTLSIFTVVL